MANTVLSRFGLLAVLLVLLMVAFMLNLFLGSASIPFLSTLKILSGFSENEVLRTIIIDYRLPKAVVAVLAGASLSVSGLQMQTIFRNPLAGPYVLGISSGAGLGVALLVLGFSVFGIHIQSDWASSLSVTAAAWAGSMAILLVVMAVAIRVKDIMTILILGMMFGSAASAIISVLQFFSSETMLKSYVLWTMGSLAGVTGNQLWILALACLAGMAITISQVRVLNVLQLGETYARNVGVSLPASRILIFISTSLLAGSVTAFCGPIGFVGIAVPHMARMVFRNADHAILLPATVIIGALVMLLSDTIAQLPGMQTTLPLNSITSLIGVPIVIYVVVRNRKFSGF